MKCIKHRILILTIITFFLYPFTANSNDFLEKAECVEGNCENGTGKSIFGKCPDIDYAEYDGEWKDGKMHGKGKLIIKIKDDEVIFIGEFKDGVAMGYMNYKAREKGVESTYEGEFSLFKENGYGKKVYGNGSIYEGMWVDGVREGKGKFITSKGSIYNGDWKKDQAEGFGTFIFSNNERYEGELANWEYNGKGTYYYSDGSKYVGTWKDGEREGEGVLYDTDGNISQQGKWIKGLFANPLNMIIKDTEEILEKDFYIYNLDVFNYYELTDTYDTELKRTTFKKSKEYKELLSKLKEKKNLMSGIWYYSVWEKPFAKRNGDLPETDKDYDIKRKGFQITNNSYGADDNDYDLRVMTYKKYGNEEDGFREEYVESQIGIILTPFPSVKCQYFNEGDKRYIRGSFFLPMTEKQGLEIEDNRDNCDVYFIYKITGSNIKEENFLASPVRVIVANDESGEVYYDRTFNSGK